MALSEPVATILASIPLAAGTVLTWRSSRAKRGASEKLVAKITERIEQNYREQIANTDKQHRETVAWLQSQILYLQQRASNRPSPPVDQ